MSSYDSLNFAVIPYGFVGKAYLDRDVNESKHLTLNTLRQKEIDSVVFLCTKKKFHQISKNLDPALFPGRVTIHHFSISPKASLSNKALYDLALTLHMYLLGSQSFLLKPVEDINNADILITALAVRSFTYLAVKDALDWFGRTWSDINASYAIDNRLLQKRLTPFIKEYKEIYTKQCDSSNVLPLSFDEALEKRPRRNSNVFYADDLNLIVTNSNEDENALSEEEKILIANICKRESVDKVNTAERSRKRKRGSSEQSSKEFHSVKLRSPSYDVEKACDNETVTCSCTAVFLYVKNAFATCFQG